jgi:hypothetical protein
MERGATAPLSERRAINPALRQGPARIATAELPFRIPRDCASAMCLKTRHPIRRNSRDFSQTAKAKIKANQAQSRLIKVN